jgi:dephospho-CoA kinase
MIVIGLTGGIGSGKSEVSRILRGFAAEIVDADKVGHEAYLKGTETYNELVAEFGDIIRQSGEIDRQKLGSIVFSQPNARKRLNEIVHPRMYAMVDERIQAIRLRGSVAVLDAAILIEAGWDALVDEIWVVSAPEELVIERINGRNGMSSEQIEQRIRSQLSSEERGKYATVVINNDGNLDQLKLKVLKAWEDRVVSMNTTKVGE